MFTQGNTQEFYQKNNNQKRVNLTTEYRIILHLLVSCHLLTMYKQDLKLIIVIITIMSFSVKAFTVKKPLPVSQFYDY